MKKFSFLLFLFVTFGLLSQINLVAMEKSKSNPELKYESKTKNQLLKILAIQKKLAVQRKRNTTEKDPKTTIYKSRSAATTQKEKQRIVLTLDKKQIKLEILELIGEEEEEEEENGSTEDQEEIEQFKEDLNKAYENITEEVLASWIALEKEDKKIKAS